MTFIKKNSPTLTCALLTILWLLVFQPLPALAQSPRESPSADTLQTPPQFPGGDQLFMQFLRDNISYPRAARNAGIEGIVYIQFVVRKDGSITDVTNLSVDARPDFAAEAIRVIELMPTWNPGRIGDNPVNVRYTLPIKFKLEQPAKKKLRQRDTLFGN